MMKLDIKKILPDVCCIILFVMIASAYFFAPVRDGKVLTGTDHSGAVGSGVEMQQYMDTHNGERTRWTNSLFSGMPTYQMAPSYKSTDTLSKIEKVYQLWLPNVIAYVFMMLLGFYIMLRAFNFKTWMAALGAILWAFSSYYFIIIAAGHIWKVLTLCFIPPTIGGMILCYRGKYLWGIVVTGLFTGLQILSNHVQMTYYFLFVIGFMGLAFLIDAIKKHELKTWTKATACFIIGGLLGVLINLSNLYHTWEYSKETMRSKSELTQKTKSEANQTKDGLERDYITAWSYGGDELLTLMIPDTKGGASFPLSMNKTAMKKANADLNYMGIYNAFTQYHGAQPGTSGPVYIGAFVCFLFILGLLIVKGPMKWCLLGATILSILLSLGHNLMPVTDFFLDYVPMYDKFRTVASILVIAEFTMPLLGLLALKQMIDDPASMHTKRVTNSLYIALGATAGACLIFWMIPSLMGPFVSLNDTQAIDMYIAKGYMDQTLGGQILASIGCMREAMFVADCKRSFFIILLGWAAVMTFRNLCKKTETTNDEGYATKSTVLVLFLAALCLFDMWSVNKRYLNDDMFVNPQPVTQMFQKTETDEMILQDPALDYRVLNLAVNTFNENSTSTYHKSIGGYHAAKLRRYQELIEAHISRESMAMQRTAAQMGGDLRQANGDSISPVLNMLNTKYLILGLQGGGTVPVLNPHANGNAWFVDELRYVSNADDELATLGNINTKHTAVANEQYKAVLGEAGQAGNSTVEMTSYEANELHYNVKSEKGGVLVFSEIFYPGWTCIVDGKDVEIGRVNYVLRAIQMPAGEHKVELKFDPQSVHTTDAIAYIALALLALIAVALIAKPFIKR